MKKVNVLSTVILLFTVFLASCKNGKLPNASITGATFGDYVPWFMIPIGALMLLFVGYNYLSNKEAYRDKILNPASIWFWCGVLGAILVVMGFVLKA